MRENTDALGGFAPAARALPHGDDEYNLHHNPVITMRPIPNEGQLGVRVGALFHGEKMVFREPNMLIVSKRDGTDF